MNQWFIGCTHFGHKNIIKYEERPFVDISKMYDTMMDNWNRVVDGSDVVYVLGDFSFMQTVFTKELMTNLNGKKILISGNHDRGISASYSIGFSAVCEYMEIKSTLGLLSLRHNPMEWIERKDTAGCIHAHIHNKFLVDHDGNSFIPFWNVNVSVEVIGYTPISLKAVEKRLVSQVHMGKLIDWRMSE